MKHPQTFTQLRRLLSVSCALALTSGCASYQAMPLASSSALTDFNQISALFHHYQQVMPLKAETINPANGLNLTELATLALLNNPTLNVNRQQYHVAQAQAFNAGLLPDPQFSVSADHPNSSVGGLVNAWGLGLSFDINSLLTHYNLKNQGAKQVEQARLDLLWQEWQVIQQTKITAVNLYFSEQKLALLQTLNQSLAKRYQQSSVGIAQGNVTLATNGTDLSALLDSYSLLKQTKQTLNEQQHQLNKLLGIDSSVLLTITPLTNAPNISHDEIITKLAHLAQFRPDLLALKAGYQAQESKVRGAIIGQFPAFNLGITKARDTGNVHTRGFTIGLTLPLFNGNKGAIAIERATRQQLANEFSARLLTTKANVDQLIQLNNILNAQQRVLADHLPTLATLLANAKKAYANNDIDALTFITMESTWFNKRLEQIDLQQAKWQTAISLATLLMLPNELSSTVPNLPSTIMSKPSTLTNTLSPTAQ